MPFGFSADHQYTHESGRVFGTGLEARKHVGRTQLFSPAQGLIDRSQWPALIASGAGNLSAAVRCILNQTSHPWCWAFSATQAAMMLAWLLYRRPIVFDPGLGPIVTHVYGGNSIDDMLLRVQASVGCVPASDTGSDPVAGSLVLNQGKWAPKWSVDAAAHTIDGWRECASFEAFVSGLLSGYPGVLGVDWQGGGHALACGLVTSENGTFFLHGPNSWGLEFDSGWGSDPDRPGWWKLSEKQVADAFTGYAYGGYVICHELTDPSLDPSPAPTLQESLV